ncbi:MAG: alkaline phosphatase family protein [Acidobacteria bacterium]|nr:alkaline phosphatase family protein [Acidobacteriota bacterium]
MAYIGPGAGFAFVSSFFTLFLVLLLAVFSLLAWPFRLLLRTLKRSKTRGKSAVDKIFIVGLDGMEPSLADRYSAEGKLPNLTRLRENGSYSKLATTIPSISPVAWSSFMTGAHPGKHNIFDFLSRDTRTYLPDLSSARIGTPKRVLPLGKYRIPLSKPEITGLRKSVPFWKILGDHHIFSTILRVPLTFPPEKFNGHLLSGMCAPDLKGSQGTFFFYTTDLEKVKQREGGVMIPVEIKDGVVETHISGPENTMLKKVEEIRLPLKIRVDKERDEAHIDVAGQKFTLKKGTFSEWKKLTFPAGLGIGIGSIARFHVSQIHPHFEMYMTPLNIDPEKPALPLSNPLIYSVYLSKLLGSYITLGLANDTWALNEGALSEEAFLELTYSNHKDWERMFFNAIDKTQQGVAACVFETTDSIQHMFFRYLDPTHPANKNGQHAMSAKVIEDLYTKMDDLVGRVMQKADDKTVIIVMSDHGFRSFRRGVNLNSWLYLNGYLSLKDGKDVSNEWFQDVDWDKTKAYALGLGGLYLNQRGREARGIVEAGEESRALKKELIEKMTSLRDEEHDGAVAITNIYDRDDLPAGPYLGNAPDLVIGYNEGYRASWDGVKGKVNRVVIDDNAKAWSGDHCIDPVQVPGVFFSNRKINSTTPHIIDIAPTVLTLFGITPPPHMDGRPLMETRVGSNGGKG